LIQSAVLVDLTNPISLVNPTRVALLRLAYPVGISGVPSLVHDINNIT
jgi:hypothetical protein